MANAVQIFPPGFRVVDTTGTPYSGAYILIREAGTDTPKDVYSDAELTNLLGSTVYTDSAGYPVTASGGTTKTLVYTGSAAYKITIKDSSDVTIAEHDNVKGAVIEGTGVGGTFLTQDAADVRYLRNPNALSAITDLSTGDKIGVYDASAAGNRQIDWDDLTADLLSEWRTAGYVFSSGARLLFQGAPPTGWTLESGASYNDATLKFTTGTPGTGGTVAFSSLFASQTFTGTVGNDTPTSAKTFSHNHALVANISNTGVSLSSNFICLSDTTYSLTGTGSGGATLGVSSTVGSSNAHNHPLTMDAFNMAAKFVSVNIGQKS